MTVSNYKVLSTQILLPTVLCRLSKLHYKTSHCDDEVAVEHSLVTKDADIM